MQYVIMREDGKFSTEVRKNSFGTTTEQAWTQNLNGATLYTTAQLKGKQGTFVAAREVRTIVLEPSPAVPYNHD